MKTLLSWLYANGYQYCTVTTTEGKRGVMISTDYEGAHPTKDILQLHDEIAKKCSRLKLAHESRGHYTAVLVTE